MVNPALQFPGHPKDDPRHAAFIEALRAVAHRWLREINGGHAETQFDVKVGWNRPAGKLTLIRFNLWIVERPESKLVLPGRGE